MQRKTTNKIEDENDNNQNMLNNEFYNDDLYDYKDCFMGNRGDNYDEEDLDYKNNNNNNNDVDVDDDDDDANGPLSINNIGNRNNNNKNNYEDDENDFNIDSQFNELDDDDNNDMIMDTFFKKVDSMELVKPKRAKIISNYLFGELLGDGSYGKVKECLDIRNLSRRAVKIINLKTISRKIPRGIQNVRKEIQIMRLLNHKNIIKLYDVFEKNSENWNLSNKIKPSSSNSNSNEKSQKQINSVTGIPKNDFSIPNMTIEKPPKLYIFMDYCMTSLEKLLKCAPNERLCNWQANFYFKQLIDGLEYLHSIGIIHNDIKPGNLLITCDDTLKICDFSISAKINLFYDYDFHDPINDDNNNNNSSDDNGLSDIFNINEHANPRKFPLVQCTPMFQCPEMLSENLNEKQIIYNSSKIDVWSSGISLYQLTTGKLPFNGQTVHQIYESIRSNTYNILYPDYLDKNLQKLLRNMLNRDPLERWSLKQIRESEWFKKKHPCVREELAQWPVDVVHNETNTYRMLQYLEKLCENDNETNKSNFNIYQQQQQQQQQNNVHLNKKSKHQNDDENNMNLKKNTINRQSAISNDDQINNNINTTNSKTYNQATKIKRNNCTIN